MSLGHGVSTVLNGLVLYYDAANTISYPGSGTSIIDICRVGNNGTLTGGIAYSSSNAGIMTYDGTSGYIDCGSAPQIGSSLTGLTVSAWIYSTSQSIRCIAENGTTFTTNTFYMFQENTTNFTFEVYGTNYDIVYSNYTYQLNTWYNLVGTWQNNARTEMYTNGVYTSGVRTGGTAQTSLRNGNANLNIGNRPGNTIYRFSGNMGPVMFYNRALSAEEIQQNFNALRGRYGI